MSNKMPKPVIKSCRSHHLAICNLTFAILFICVQIASGELRPEMGVVPLGMSGAVVSYSDEPAGAIWNPANLALLRKGFVIYDLSQGVFLLDYSFRKLGSLGISVIDLNSDDRFMIADPNNPIGTFQTGDIKIMFSIARDFRRWM